MWVLDWYVIIVLESPWLFSFEILVYESIIYYLKEKKKGKKFIIKIQSYRDSMLFFKHKDGKR